MNSVKVKGICDGKWVYGTLIQEDLTNNGVYILKEYSTYRIVGDEVVLYANNFFEPIPETVCRCSGFKDSEGTLIYQGDIVEVSMNGVDYQYEVVCNNGDVVLTQPLNGTVISLELIANIMATHGTIKVLGNIYDPK